MTSPSTGLSVEDGRERPAHPTCVGPAKIGPGDQRIGLLRLAGDTARARPRTRSPIWREAIGLKEVMADLTLENRLLKKA
jgi:hypothetical protein